MVVERSRNAHARVLVHAPNWVGDHAMAFPFYAALTQAFAGAEFTLVGRAWVTDLAPDGFATVLAFNGKELNKADFQRLKESNFDVGFTLSPSFRSAWLLYRLGARRRHGFATDLRSFLLTRQQNKFRKQRYNRSEHRALAYLRLLTEYLPSDMLPEDLFEKYRNVKLSALPIAPVDARFGLRRKGQYVIVCPGSTAASKKYPVGHLIQAIEFIAKKKPAVQFLLLGAKIDADECAAIESHFAGGKIRIANLCARTTLREAHTLIAWAKVVIANDSGLAHITSLTGTALITFNGMGRREETSPLTRYKTLFDLQLDCSPCFRRECPRKDQPLACLTGIAPAAVAEAALFRLG